MTPTSAQFLKKGHGKTGAWVDLVNSEEWDTRGKLTDWLDEPSWLPYFLRRWQFPSPAGQAFPAGRFRALRSMLRKSCEALFAGGSLPNAELRAINDAMNVSGKQELIQRQNGLQVAFIPGSKGWDWILAQIALSFAQLLAQGERARITGSAKGHVGNGRVKICRNPNCRWVFYDATKGATRKWCSDTACGNLDRVRRARAKAARRRQR